MTFIYWSRNETNLYFSTELFITRIYAIILIFKTLHHNVTCFDYQVFDAALSFRPKMGAHLPLLGPSPNLWVLQEQK